MDVPLIPESAPFTPSQRAWLNGFFAGMLSIDPAEIGAAPGPAPGSGSSATAVAEPGEAETPWHDSTLPMDDRMKLAEGRPVADRLMAAMAQLDCGACGYLCRTYSNAIADGAEKDLSRCVPGGRDTSKALKEIIKATPITVSAVPRPDAAAPAAAAESPKPFDRQNPYLATVLTVKKLNKEGSDKDTRFVAIDIAGSGLTYEAGDSLGVYPRNCYEQVNALVRLLGLGGGEPVITRSGRATAFREALISECDIDTPRDELYELLAGYANDPEQAKLLRKLAAGESIPQLVDDARVLDVLACFPSARPQPTELVKALPQIIPRLYSIASSPRMYADEVHLTVGVVRYVKNGQGRKGLASTFLAERVLPFEPVKVFVQKSHFRPPADPLTRCMMIGPGTGIAPFRAFLQDRQARGGTGRNWVFFGDQKRATDFLYEHELQPWVDSGFITRLDLAFSRDQKEKVYVQDRMLESGAELFRWIEDGGHVYVCGDAKRMAVDVDRALKRVVVEHGRMTPEAAVEYVAAMSKAGRYQRDVY